MFDAVAVGGAIEASETVLAWLAIRSLPAGSGGWWVTNPVMKAIVFHFFDTMASTVSATLRADSCVSAVA